LALTLRDWERPMDDETAPMILEDFTAFLIALIAEALDRGLPDEAIAAGLEEAAAAMRGKLS
jgi:hypothetical protein